MKKNTKKRVLVYVLAVVALYLIIYMVPRVTGLLTGTYTAKYAELRVTTETTGYLVRDEQVYVTSHGGEVNRFVEEGDLVRKGTTVMEVTGNSDSQASDSSVEIVSNLDKHKVETGDYAVEVGGVVSYFADGLEESLSFDKFKSKNYDFFQNLSQSGVMNLSDKHISAGEPAFKVVDKSRWYLVAFADAKDKSKYVEGADVKVEFTELGSKDDRLYVDMVIDSVEKDGNQIKIIMESNRFFDEYCQLRVCDICIITSEAAGLIVDNDSIVKKKGKTGVYVKDKKDKYNFVEVNPLATDGKKTVISDSYFYNSKGERAATVDPYDDILKNPAKAE